MEFLFDIFKDCIGGLLSSILAKVAPPTARFCEPHIASATAKDTLNKWGNQGAGVSKITGFRDLFRVSLSLMPIFPHSGATASGV